MHQYFGYTRVSTAKQGEKGVSLQEQRDAITRYAGQFGLEVSRWFEEKETAAKRGRPVFTEMLRLLTRKQSRGVIIHKIDRSARNLRDWADLGEMIDAGIEVHFANESLDLHTRGGRLSADIQAVVASDYIRNLREETKKGFYGRLKQGLYPLGAPIGYLDQGKGKVKAIDPNKGPLVRQAFELYATGRFTLETLLDELQRRGLRNKVGKTLSLNGISTVLRNPFYMGLIRIKKTNELFQGNHEPLVGKSLYDSAQRILQGKTAVRALHHGFTYRRLIACGVCAYSLIGELQKGHVYYRCQTKGCLTKTIREEAVEDCLRNALAPATLDDAETECARIWVRNARLAQDSMREQEIGNARLMLDQNQTRRTRLTDAFLDGTIDKELFEERKAALLLESTGLKERIALLERRDESALVKIENFLELVKTASLLYREAFPDEKRDLVQKLTSNLSAVGKNVSVELKTEAQIIASREKTSCCSLQRGRPRTETEPRTNEGTLQKLLELFTKEPLAGAA
jgi:site-specific DNA recombinase